MNEFKVNPTTNMPPVTRTGNLPAGEVTTRAEAKPAVSLPAPKPPPRVKQIREAVQLSFFKKRPLLVVLEEQTQEAGSSIDLQA